MEKELVSPKYGKFIVYYDEQDYDLINNHKWYISKAKKKFNVRTHIKRNGIAGTIVMNNLIIGQVNGLVIYLDGNYMNNCRNNIFILEPNVYIKFDGYYEIIISHRKYGKRSAFIDECDYDIIKDKYWCIKHQRNRFYANCQYVTMHRLLMNFPKKMEVDHIDNDGLNNRRYNLRIGTHSQNGMNRGLQSNNVTGFKGVYLAKDDGRVKRYWVYIWVNMKRISGGYFEKILDAAKKYNELAKIHHGDFAKLNIIPNE